MQSSPRTNGTQTCQSQKVTVPKTSLHLLNSSLVHYQFVESANYWDSNGTKWMTLYVSLPSEPAKLSKRCILANLTLVYDLLGLVSPSVLEGKQVCGEASDMKLSRDIPLPTGIAKRWLRRDKNAPNDVYFPRSLVQCHEPINNIKLHAFGDANSHGVCAVAHAVITQALGVTQGLIAAKSCLAKKSLIPRLELMSGHMAVNFSTNVWAAPEGLNMT